MKKQKIVTSHSPVPKKDTRKTTFSEVSFPEAIKLLIGGAKIHRAEWQDKEEYGLLQDSFLMIHRNGKFHQWIVSEGDLMAIDWQII